ncbi:DMT family transporter [Oceanomicrobium pacificus]|uniref:EamA family transporter n=1 Tax=Oceanomicrobium pacificus TaxID=2692916 RepID=A0A6B0TNX6_9RHOB|nr:DMT family transporter [Oceanomicrobium pacificus]MXU66257.1 EamA family transporter [Oceanomicrobium pacificus]
MTASRALAWGALAVTISIWAGFLVMTRAATGIALGPVEVGLMRFGIPALLFAPLLWRKGLLPDGANLTDMVLIALGGGFLFVWLLTTGLRFAPVADSGVFGPSLLPVFVALLSALFLQERIDGLRRTGFVIILAGALLVGGWQAVAGAEPGAWRGHLLFIGASFTWAVYLVRFRFSGMGAKEAAAMIAFWSTLAFLLAALVTGTRFAEVPVPTLLFQFAFHGLLSGFLAAITIGYAVRHLGASTAAAFAALVPVLAALGGWVFLGEPVSALKALGIVAVSVGVALAAGARLPRQRVLQD